MSDPRTTAPRTWRKALLPIAALVALTALGGCYYGPYPYGYGYGYPGYYGAPNVYVGGGYGYGYRRYWR